MCNRRISLERAPWDFEVLHPQDWRRLLDAARDRGWADQEAYRRARAVSSEEPVELTSEMAAGLADALERVVGADADMARVVAAFCRCGGFEIAIEELA
jgi:hypothetical protein